MPLRLLALSIVVGMSTLTAAAYGGARVQSATSVRQRMDGERLFRAYCAPCHGADGKGQGPAASALKTAPADLTTIAMRNGGVFPRDRVSRYVAKGEPAVAAHGSADMPVWGPNFAALVGGRYRPVKTRIDAVVAYLAYIQTVQR